MKREPLTTIAREVESWSGVTTGDTGRGGLQFNYGRVELGHLHGSSFADLPFPKKIRNELVAAAGPRYTTRCRIQAGYAGGCTAPATRRP